MSKLLIGKTLTGIKIASDKQALLLIAEDGEYVVRVDGECCSYSWIESIEMPALGFPAKIISIDDFMMQEDIWTEGEELTQFYGCKISTDKGDIVIDYRNSSNGYYGGDIIWPDDDYHYGGVHGQNDSNMEWEEIKV